MSKIAKTVNVESATSVEMMLQDSGTDWDAKIVPANMGTGQRNGGFYGVLRGDTETPLSFVSERFRINSHRAQLAALSPLVESGVITPSNVAIWDNGAILAYQFRVPSLMMNVGGRDRVDNLLTLMFGYGFKIKDMAFFCGFRAFCKNQLGQMWEAAGGDRVGHRGDNMQDRYADILGKRITELTGAAVERTERMTRMCDKQLTGKPLVDYFAASLGLSAEDADKAWVTPPEDLRGPIARIPEIAECYQQDKCGAEGSLWHAYNAVTRYTTHVGGRNEANRLRSGLMGASATITARAWDTAGNLLTAAA